MKTFVFATILSLFAVSVNAQQHNHDSTASTSRQQPLSQLLRYYYDVKDALISGDAAAAASRADVFEKALNGADMQLLLAKEMDPFMAAQKKLAADAAQIAQSKDIQKQREAFAALSADMVTLAKGVKLSAQPIYQQYCPMKKASWLSSEAAIRNPYFGKQMLTCGKVTETLQ